MLDIIFPIVIFASLAVIIFIVGKHLPDFKHIKKEQRSLQTKSGNPIKNFFKKIAGFLKDFFIVSAEWIVKQSKDALGLIHSQLLKLKKKKNEKFSTERKAGSSSFPEKDILDKEGQKNDIGKTKSFGAEKAEDDKSYPENSEKDKSFADSFFSKGVGDTGNSGNEKTIEKEESSRKISIWLKIKNKIDQMKDSIKEYFLKRRRRRLDEVFSSEEEPEGAENFSDGGVEVSEKEKSEESGNGNLIKEVVAVEKKRKPSPESDDELGVDRKILEKKLINKIAQNPKDAENYRQLGELYLKMENYSDSLDCYKQVLRFKTRDVDAKRKIERINLLKRFK
ncbi:MAG: tetratricopeptide repeat protein [Patescibacteria group bacterium]